MEKLTKNSLLLLFFFLTSMLLACNSKSQTPVDNPSIMDTAPQFGPDKLIVLDKLAATAIGEPLKEGEITNYEGEKSLLTKTEGRPMLIGFWASWCKPCHEDRPYLEKVVAKYPDLDFYYLSIDKKMAEAQAYFETKGKKPAAFDYWLGYDPNQPLHWYNLKRNIGGSEDTSITTIPTYVLVSEEGIILEKSLPRPSEGGFEATVRKLLGM